MSKIDISRVAPIERLFHNEKIKTYETQVELGQIKFWRRNLRTILAFDRLENEKQKKLEDISLEEITYYLASRSEIKLTELAHSIEQNGVRVPLILLDDSTLLDGNRRYFACSYLYHEAIKNKRKPPEVLSNITVHIIKAEDIEESQKNKILAEANYIDDLKVPWSLDVKARVISDYFNVLISDGNSETEAYNQIKEVYGLDKSDVQAYVDTTRLTDEYIESGESSKEQEFKRREHVLRKFIYFWEFRNVTSRGRNILDSKELSEVKPMFFRMITNGFMGNLKLVRPLVSAYRDKDLWEMLEESGGAQILQVDAILKEEKAIKSSEDKVRNFIRWLDKQDADRFSKATLKLFHQLNEKIGGMRNE